MDRHPRPFDRFQVLGVGLLSAVFALAPTPSEACTIFVLTDGTRALFFNNEDYSNPATRIWFVPAGNGFHGCAYLGFDDGWAQGGLNAEGLAFDWVAGFMEQWVPPPGTRSVRGNPSERMLETCSTVDDAIAFYRTHQEPDFARARILVADRTGSSAIIGAGNGELRVERANRPRGFGYGRRTLERMLSNPPEPTVANGVRILWACLQEGPNATKYSNAFDLGTGQIFVYPSPGRDDAVRLHLVAELAKGEHYYDIPRIRQQLADAPQPLLDNMKRFFLDTFDPIPDQEPHVTRHLRGVLQDVSAGTMRADDYTDDLWSKLLPVREQLQADLNRLGPLVSMVLVDRGEEDGRRTYRYRVSFEHAIVLQLFVLDRRNRLAATRSEHAEQYTSGRVE